MITITGEPKEIAALVVALQERQLSELKEGVCLTAGLMKIDSDCEKKLPR